MALRTPGGKEKINERRKYRPTETSTETQESLFALQTKFEVLQKGFIELLESYLNLLARSLHQVDFKKPVEQKPPPKGVVALTTVAYHFWRNRLQDIAQDEAYEFNLTMGLAGDFVSRDYSDYRLPSESDFFTLFLFKSLHQTKQSKLPAPKQVRNGGAIRIR